MAGRSGHYMPESLLASQLQTLEPPGADEPDVQRLEIEQPVEALIDAAVRALRPLRSAGGACARA